MALPQHRRHEFDRSGAEAELAKAQAILDGLNAQFNEAMGNKEALEAKREANRERRANNAAHGGTGAGEATEHHAMGQVHGDSAGSEDARKACREEQRKAGNHDPVKIQAACSGAGGGGAGRPQAQQFSSGCAYSDPLVHSMPDTTRPSAQKPRST